MVSEFVVVWVELNWLRDVAGSVFFCEKGRPPGGCFEMLRCRIVLEFLDGFCVIFSMACGIVGVSYKIFLSVWTFLELRVLKRFPFFVTVIFMKGRFMVFSCFICVV